MSLEAALSRISQIETALSLPSSVGKPSPSGGAGLPSGTTTAGGAGSFAAQLQSAVSPSAYAAGIGGSAFAASPLSSALGGVQALSGSGPSPAAQAIVQIAESQVGQAEQPPGSNDSPAIATYRSATQGAEAGAPWCAYFASWAAREAGEPIGSQGQGLGYVGDVWNWAQSSGRAIVNGPGVTPTPGDLIVFGDRHIGIVEKVLPGGSIQTIEGNYENQVSRVIRGAGEASGYVKM